MINEVTSSWIFLSVAIIFGVMGTIAMKLSHGLTYVRPVLVVLFSYAVSFIALTFAIKHIELIVVYTVWSGAGTFLVATIGILHFHESVSLKKLFFLLLIIFGVIGMHLGDLTRI